MIEMLVVFGVLVILIALLLPAVSTARRGARSVQCASSLHQLALASNLYASDNRGSTMNYAGTSTGFNSSYGVAWAEKLNPYLAQGIDAYRLCPETAVQRPRTGTNPGSNNVAYVADYTSGVTTTLWDGSYGINLALVCDYTSAPGVFKNVSELPQGGTRVPVFSDCVWRDIVPLNNVGAPPDLNFGGRTGPNFNSIQRVCIDRHYHAVNVGFGDGHVDRVMLPELWQLQWSATTTSVSVAGSAIFSNF